jgi:hypothetical protein
MSRPLRCAARLIRALLGQARPAPRPEGPFALPAWSFRMSRVAQKAR